MTAFGPAALSIIAFVGVVSTLASVYAIEQWVRQALGLTRTR